ncbi:MAG TPA: COX15/CtaA family protein [Acidimicrobiia bacterium]|nr:COX15/CtaA family protein [Acidimicrobiia bacterium]
MANLVRYAWFVLFFNVVVIVLGALVRATGSGAGCGRSWPTCDGRVIPEMEGATAIEFTHRGVSGIALLLVFALAVLTFRKTSPGHSARTGAVLSVIAIVGEALIGAMIVLAEWVADDTSVARAVSVPLHLVNTLFLLAALALTIFWLSGGNRLSFREDHRVTRAVVIGGIALVLIAASGAVTALADTLFPKGAGVDLSGEEHFLTRLRIVHPVLAVVAAATGWWAASRSEPGRGWAALALPLLVAMMLITGFVNVVLGVPVWMQLVHIALADALWVAYVFASAQALQFSAATASRLSPSR